MSLIKLGQTSTLCNFPVPNGIKHYLSPLQQCYSLISSESNFCLSFKSKPSFINTLSSPILTALPLLSGRPSWISPLSLPPGKILPISQAQLKSTLLRSLAQSFIPITLLHPHSFVLQLTFPYSAFHSHCSSRGMLPQSTVPQIPSKGLSTGAEI